MTLNLLIVGLSGFFGSIARYLVYIYFGPRNATSFPWATFFVNVTGCLLIGIIGALIERSVPYHRHLYLVGSVGFLGAFTTFSAFGLETISLLRNQQSLLALMNVGANLVLGFVAVVVGRFLATQL